MPSLLFIDQPEPQNQFDTSRMTVEGEDLAGLKALPVTRMLRQAGRPMSPERRVSNKPDPALHDMVIKRNQKAADVIEKWDPTEAEWKQRDNNWRSNPRSKSTAAPDDAIWRYTRDLADRVARRARNTFFSMSEQEARDIESGRISAKKAYEDRAGAYERTSVSELMTDKERQSFKQMLFQTLDENARKTGATKANKYNVSPAFFNVFPKLTNDLLYEWNMRRERELRERTIDAVELRRMTIKPI